MLVNQPAFIVCCPRSGSTWLRLLLDAHPEIACGNETFLFTGASGFGTMIEAYKGMHGHKGLGRYIGESELYDALRTFCDLCFGKYLERRGKAFLVEKSVDHALVLETILRVYPEARIIHLVRDGRDVSCSIIEASKRWQPSWPQTLPMAARMWTAYNSAIVTAAKAMRPANYVRLHYESLMNNPQCELSRIFAFLGARELEGSQLNAMIGANRFDELKRRYSHWREGLFFRHGRVGEWREVFSKRDCAEFQAEAEEMMSLLDYEV